MPKHKTSGIDNKNETSTLALGQKVGANENTCVMPTGMSTAENTRLKASKGESSRTRPVALRTKTLVEPCGFESLMVDIVPSLLVFNVRRLWRRTLKEKGLCEDTSRSGRG